MDAVENPRKLGAHQMCDPRERASEAVSVDDDLGAVGAID
jgi:hypothetical protein